MSASAAASEIRDISALGLRPATASDLLDLLWDARELQQVPLDPDAAMQALHEALDRDDRQYAWQILSAEIPRAGAALTYACYLAPDERAALGNLQAINKYAGELNGLAGLLALRQGTVLATRRLWLESLVAHPQSAKIQEALRDLAEQWPAVGASAAASQSVQAAGAHVEEDRRQILEDLLKAGWGTLAVIVLKDQVADTVGFATTVVILPPDLLVASMTSGRGFSQEVIALGTRQALKALLPAGSSLALAESLLTFARSLRTYHGALGALDVIVHATLTMKAIGHARGFGRALLDLGVNLKDHELFYDALRALDLSDRQSFETGDAGAMAAAAYHRATICRRFGQSALAITFLDDGVRMLPSVTESHAWNAQFRSERLLNLMALDRRAEARACIDEWLFEKTDGEVSALRSRFSVPLAALGDLEDRDGNTDTALACFAAAAANAAREILAFRTARFRTNERENIGHVLDRAVAAAAAAGAADLCFGVLQLARTGSLSLAARRRAFPVTDEGRVAQAEQLSQLVQRAAAAASAGTDLRGLQQEAEWMIGARDFVHTDAAVGQLPSDRAGVEALASAVRQQLDEHARLVEYAWIGGRLMALLLDRDRATLHDLRLSRQELTKLIADMLSEIETGEREDALNGLTAAVLAPLEGRLRGGTRLFTVPAEGMQAVPFHALSIDGTPLVESCLVHYLDRAAALTASGEGHNEARVTADCRCDALAVPEVMYGTYPELPGVSREVEVVHSVFPAARVATACAAADFLAAASADVVHLACHALPEPEAPLLTRVLLSDRPVFAFEIALTSFDAQLVTLSACDTATGPSFTGGRTDTLAAALLGAGAREVAATLWPLDDEVAVLFIERFYAHLTQAGSSAAEAVQAAQRHIRAMPAFRHPYFWAPFVVFGSGRPGTATA